MTNVLSVENLTVNLAKHDRSFNALSGLSFSIRKGEVLALVGESGSGKSMTAMSIMQLLPEPVAAITGGSILYGGIDLTKASERQMQSIRGNKIGLIFQEPMTSLNPSMQVGLQVAESLQLHKGMSKADARKHTEELFDLVRIPDPKRRFDDYPHHMSGGMRQRVVIALALACNPDVLIADEPTTALDVTIQAQILDIIRELQQKVGTATILITHDMAVVAETADRVAVMYTGQIVEEASSKQIFSIPRHPYTNGLLKSIPHITSPNSGEKNSRLFEISGMVPPLWELPKGCTFAPRCPKASNKCLTSRPSLVERNKGHNVACWHPEGEIV